MTQLNFSQDATSGYWVATTTVNADFNVHVERDNIQGFFAVEVNTIYSVSGSSPVNKYREDYGIVFDTDFHGCVYPKQVIVTSETQPIAAKSYITESD